MSDKPDGAMDWFRDAEIETAKRVCLVIFGCGILSSKNVRHPLFEAAVTHLLIGLNDLCQKARSEGKRIALTEHIQITPERSDVTDLIRECRNACCHIPSGYHNIGGGRFSFNVAVGKCNVGRTRDVVLGCEFEDDIAVFWGTSRLYLSRNALAAFKAALALYPGQSRGG